MSACQAFAPAGTRHFLPSSRVVKIPRTSFATPKEGSTTTGTAEASGGPLSCAGREPSLRGRAFREGARGGPLPPRPPAASPSALQGTTRQTQIADRIPTLVRLGAKIRQPIVHSSYTVGHKGFPRKCVADCYLCCIPLQSQGAVEEPEQNEDELREAIKALEAQVNDNRKTMDGFPGRGRGRLRNEARAPLWAASSQPFLQLLLNLAYPVRQDCKAACCPSSNNSDSSDLLAGHGLESAVVQSDLEAGIYIKLVG